VSWQEAIARLGVAGTTWRDVELSVLAGCAAQWQDEGWLRDVRASYGLEELCVVATCNRAELVFLVGAGADPSPRLHALLDATGKEVAPSPRIRLRRGEAAFEHLIEVAAGLDSAMPGEREIRGQLRESVRRARASCFAGARLERVAHEALRIAARVHEETDLGSGRASIAELAVQRVLDRLRRTPGRVLLVGVSPMTRHAASRLAAEGFAPVVANRTVARAAELAARHGGEALSLSDLPHATPAVEAVLTATSSLLPLIERPTLERMARRTDSGQPPLLVDLAVPPDVDPASARAAGLERVGLEDLVREAADTRERRSSQVTAARAAVGRHLDELRRRRAERALSPILRDLGARYRDTAREGIERLLAQDLRSAPLQPSEREALLEWADSLARRLAHVPTAGLRALSARCGPSAVESFLSGADPGLLDALVQADLQER
jgi:glutamyl-tRNA reductase